MDTFLITTHTNGIYLCKLDNPQRNDVAFFETSTLLFQLAHIVKSRGTPLKLNSSQKKYLG